MRRGLDTREVGGAATACIDEEAPRDQTAEETNKDFAARKINMRLRTEHEKMKGDGDEGGIDT